MDWLREPGLFEGCVSSRLLAAERFGAGGRRGRQLKLAVMTDSPSFIGAFW